ncbi:hypothetical protein [Kitasatospora sp. NPDC059673]|uniref:hypothetical protein n=1 Tax=Kitasatospora sp. NPDC059673 TaxID=3346901 RepID=UPI00367A5258
MNQPTARWARTDATPGRNAVFSAPLAWAPSAFLAVGAAGPAVCELALALGVRPHRAAEAGRELVAGLDMWTRAGLPVELRRSAATSTCAWTPRTPKPGPPPSAPSKSSAPLRPGSALGNGEPGPGLRALWRRSRRRDHQLDVSTTEFDLAGERDLLSGPGLFGLRSATDTVRGHFPGISSAPLAIGAAAQFATAFGATAAGVSSRKPPYLVRRIEVRFDRPFAFLAVHRGSRLVLAAGWVAEPRTVVNPWGSG